MRDFTPVKMWYKGTDVTGDIALLFMLRADGTLVTKSQMAWEAFSEAMALEEILQSVAEEQKALSSSVKYPEA